MKTIPDFAVSSQEAGFDKFLKVYNEYFKFDFFGNAKFYGAKNGENYQTGQAWITPITPSEAIALLTGKQLTEGERDFRNGTCRNCRPEECTNNCYPTQESVKQEEYEKSLDDFIVRVSPFGTSTISNPSVRKAIQEFLDYKTAHLQQQLNTLTSEIKRFQEKYDENGYDCSNEIKLLRIENHIDSTLSFYHKEVTDLQQQLKEAKELLEESFPIIQAAITLLRVAPNNNTLPEPPHDVIKLVKSINQFLTSNQ